jgi:allantoinase
VKKSSRKKNSQKIDRDFIGYGNRKFDFAWPDGKRLALSLVVNYEEGSEHSYALDKTIEGIGEFLPVDVPIRDPGNESVYEYGPRVAVWRILDTFKKYDVKATFFATALALKANELAAKAIVDQGHEICDHGLRWTEHFKFNRRQEESMIRESVKMIEQIAGKKPVGFYAREPSDDTIDIVHAMKNFIYDSDEYNDDLPYRYGGKSNNILILPYTPDANDFHFQSPMHRFSNSEDFFLYLKDTLDVLREEAIQSPKMMSVGLHCRVIGRPGRIVALKKFLDYVNEHSDDDVWVATREQIARYWIEQVEAKGLV